MPEPLKDLFFGRPFFDDLAAAIKTVYPAFDAEALLRRIFDDQWEGRELKDRMRHTTITLHDLLPPDYRAALAVLRQIAPRLDRHGFEKMIFPDFVERYGLDDWEASLPALEQFTQAASAEFAVRPFILKDQARMMAQLLAWAGHESPALRRLASEGCRPRLPWAIALPPLKADPSPILPILERLKHDPSEDVRRSVANNLNDISKDHPQVVINMLRRWRDDDGEDMRPLIHRALRTLVKAGHPEALELLGYASECAVAVRGLTVEPAAVALGGEVTFSFDLESTGQSPQDLMIDYVVHLMRANGRQTPKVFKLTTRTIAPGETVHLRKKHSFKPVTTRKYYPGEHAVEIQVNGQVLARADFTVR